MVLLTLQHIQTDAAELVNIGVVDPGEKADLWWCHRIIVREEEFQPENATFSSGQSEE